MPGPGEQLGPYEIDAKIGSGGMATVFRGFDPDGKSVALKVVDPSSLLPEDIRRFTREFKALIKLDNPHIVRVFEAGETRGYPWMAMEYVEGQDLDEVIAAWRNAPPADRFETVDGIFRALCDALESVHNAGLIHRDLKPSNVLWTHDGVVKLSDFGVVKASDATSQITMTGRLVGTIAYMAPELISGEELDHRADLYGLGALLYTLLTLERPIEADSLAGYLARHLTHKPTPPHEIDPNVPAGLERVCLRLLSKNPARRYASAKAALRDLDRDDASERPEVFGRDELLLRWRSLLQGQRTGTSTALGISGPLGSGRSVLLRHFADMADDEGLTVGSPSLTSEGYIAWTTLEGQRLSRPPSIIMLDDLENLSNTLQRAALDIVEDAREDNATVLVFSVDDEQAETLSSPLMLAEIYRLEPLTAPDISAYLRHRKVPAPVASALSRRLQGTESAWPAMVEDQLQALLREQWLVPEDGRLVAQRSLSAFRRHDLPIPDGLRQLLTSQLDDLSGDARELVEILAAIKRPCSASLLGRVSSRPARTPMAIDRLITARIVETEAQQDDVNLKLCNPAMGIIALSRLSETDKQARHAAIAQSLLAQRRRRSGAAEVAHHLAASQQLVEAIPLYLRAGKQAARNKDYTGVLRAARSAAPLLSQVRDRLSEEDAAKFERDFLNLEGNALLALGKWSEATPVLEAALVHARQSDDQRAQERTLTALGRSYYRLGNFAKAQTHLRDAVDLSRPESPSRAKAARALADIHLQAGELNEAEQLFETALENALIRRSSSDEARARRGMAHVLGMRHRLVEAGNQLTMADELLSPSGDSRVRAGILSRSIELETNNGRYDIALHRSEMLLDLLRTHQLADRFALGFGISAGVRAALGRDEEAIDHARQGILYGRSRPSTHWDGLLRAGRVLLAKGQAPNQLREMLDPSVLPQSPLHQPRAQTLTFLARLVAPDSPDLARQYLSESAPIPAAFWNMSRAYLMLDKASALLSLGEIERALEVVETLESAINPEQSLGVALECNLIAIKLNRPEARSKTESLVRAISSKMSSRLARGFLRREDLQEFQPKP